MVLHKVHYLDIKGFTYITLSVYIPEEVGREIIHDFLRYFELYLQHSHLRWTAICE
jgi:hypothetical protein